jgi:hypothetical protein
VKTKMSRMDRACDPRAAGASRQSPESEEAAPRFCARGSRPVSERYALGICRRRAQPSF